MKVFDPQPVPKGADQVRRASKRIARLLVFCTLLLQFTSAFAIVVEKPPMKSFLQHFSDGLGMYANLVVAWYHEHTGRDSHSQGTCSLDDLGLPPQPPGGNMYETLGVENIAGKVATKAWKKDLKKKFRQVSLKWHPDKHKPKSSSGYNAKKVDKHRAVPAPSCGAAVAEVRAREIFEKLAWASEVLMNEELRDIYDRFGDEGLQRHQDGDPRVKKGWLPDDEILRRHGINPSDNSGNLLDDFVCGVFAWLEGRSSNSDTYA